MPGSSFLPSAGPVAAEFVAFAPFTKTGMRKLLTVEDTFRIEGRGVIVTPKIPVDGYRGPLSCTVCLRRPDGTERNASAAFDIPFVHPPPPAPYYVCFLVSLTKEDVPVGTEIWVDG
jgi:hypothetical protein